ncbi:hypothetical protein BV898_18474 [Hypsibius exemplaris]|uniref:Transposase n=1 Tax=Hypsibius exemplaris TaxID=2072580 RepID=A0A9X6RNI4_HYPEX|nr:hypothetical protein BV898_18474 [Hypsibius exemplaris]
MVRAVFNLIRKNTTKEAGSDTAPSSVKPRGSPKLRTPGLVAAIEKDLSGPNPLTRLHYLEVKQRVVPRPEVPALHHGREWKNFVTIDEAWVYLTDVNGIRKIYYEFREKRSPESWTKFWKESHPKGVMFVVGVVSGRKTAFRFVKPGAKINSEHYIQHVLKPLFKNDIRKLFSGELINKVVFQYNSASAHSSESPKNSFEILESSSFRKSNGWATALIWPQ